MQSHLLKVTVRPELVDAVARGLSLTVIGQASLPAPLAGMVVLARSSPPPKGSLALAAVLQPRTLLKSLALSCIPLRKRGAPLLGDDYVLGPGLINQLVLHCGGWPFMVPLISPSAPARPLPDAGAAGAELERFAAILVEILRGVYKAKPPALELTLAPSGLTVEGALSAVRKVRDVAADVAARATRGDEAGTPGRVYQPPPDAGGPASFDDVGGLEEAKTQVRALVQAVKDPESYRRWGARPPRGLLLWGPPGTGKTLLARVLAHESGAKFIAVRASDITSKWYGEAEKRLQDAFDWARRDAPAVLFFDEIDALGGPREFSHEATHRIVSTFLHNLDGLEPLNGVFVVAATNRPEAVDDALTRPGRFDRLVEVPLPDGEGRRAIFEVHMRRSEQRAGRRLFDAIDEGGWERLLDATGGQNGAEIEEIVRRALERKVRAGAAEGLIGQEDLLVEAVGVGRRW